MIVIIFAVLMTVSFITLLSCHGGEDSVTLTVELFISVSPGHSPQEPRQVTGSSHSIQSTNLKIFMKMVSISFVIKCVVD